MTLYRDQGVVLRTMRLGEADRIVTMLCRTHGKVRAVAKGVRRTTSRFGGRLEPLSHVSLLCWQGQRARHRQPGRGPGQLPAGPRGPEPGDQGLLDARGGRRVSVERHAAPRLYELLVKSSAHSPSETLRSCCPPSS